MTSASTYPHTHNPNNHLSRRASISATAPYIIPNRNNHNQNNTPTGTAFSPSHSNIHIPQHQQNHPISNNSTGHTSQLSSSAQHIHHHQQHHQQQHHHQQHHHHNHHSTSHNSHDDQLSSSVPLLSRDFVVRRISEGESGRLKHELKCEACGKGYKHISSLAKHLWEHTPEWNVTKKLLISKHQQVQLLEAASILVSMNEVDKEEIEPLNEVKFNQKYQEHSPQPILEENEEHENEHENEHEHEHEHEHEQEHQNHNIKLRADSISQYPPSQSHLGSTISYKQHSESPIPPPHHNMNHGPGSPAIYHDSVINNGGFLDTPLKKNTGLNKENLQQEEISNAIEDESESPDSNQVNEEDDGTVFGKMD